VFVCNTRVVFSAPTVTGAEVGTLILSRFPDQSYQVKFAEPVAGDHRSDVT
jgi:hypothetical protein